MNTKLLRLVRYHRSSCPSAWVFYVPGHANPVTLHFNHPLWKVPAVTWPHRESRSSGGEIVRGARLDWHRSVVKSELRALIKRVAERLETV